MSRPSRRCKSASTAPAPASVTELDYYKNYVSHGYIGDDVPIEVIMRRFEVQEKMASLEEPLQDSPEEHIAFDLGLYEHCNVQSPIQEQLYDSGEEIIEDDEDADETFEVMNFGEDYDDNMEDLESDEYELYASYYIDDDEDEDGRRRYRKRQKIVNGGAKRKRPLISLSGSFGNFGIITTKKTSSKKDAYSVFQIDTSWAKTIKPLHQFVSTFTQDAEDEIETVICTYDLFEDDEEQITEKERKSDAAGRLRGDVYKVPQILDFDYGSLSKFNAVLIDPPWEKISVKDLSALPFKDFITDGYAFIWVEKQHIQGVLSLMSDNNFDYIENLCWVKENVNHMYRREDYPYLAGSHLTMLIFKKNNENTRRMDIRHQRNPDVVFDFFLEDFPREKPSYVYHMIETLLPAANGFLELWGSRFNKEGKKTNKLWTNLIEEGDKVYE
ncbi:mettl3 [Acrasis kona]|uniref:Mettl3 n=1 Tax=Acrasis kona TaxID=1008807 RepID=A0AAW2ZJ95_9EUKA